MDELLQALGLANNGANIIYVNSAVRWINENTVYKADVNEGIKDALLQLFILKYAELMTNRTGVASESISGMSQSFNTGQSLEASIYNLATAILGVKSLKSTVVVRAGEDRWSYGS